MIGKNNRKTKGVGKDSVVYIYIYSHYTNPWYGVSIHDIKSVYAQQQKKTHKKQWTRACIAVLHLKDSTQNYIFSNFVND